jgi:hypothetical protein
LRMSEITCKEGGVSVEREGDSYDFVKKNRNFFKISLDSSKNGMIQ